MLSERPWKTEAALLFAAALMAALSFLSLSLLVVRHLIPEDAGPTQSLFDFLLGNAGLYAISLLLVHFFLKHHQVGWSDFLGWIRPHRWRKMAWGALAGLAVILPTWELKKLSAWAMHGLELLPEEQGAIQVLVEARTWHQYAAFAVSAVGLAPLVEEALFRGILYSFLKKHARPAVALCVSAVLFSAIHGSLVTFVPLVLMAMVLIWIYEKTDCLLAPIAAHAIFNAVNFAQLVWQTLSAPPPPFAP